MKADPDAASGDPGIRASLRALAPYFRPYPRLLVLIGLGLLVEAAFNVFLPLSFSFLIDKALIPKDKHVLVVVLVALGLGVVITGVVAIARDRLYAQLTSSVIADLRGRIFSHLQTLSLGFYARMQLGDILARFSGDLVALEGAFTSALTWAIAPSLDVCVYTVVLFILDWRLALVAMLVWPIALLGPRYFAPRAVTGSYEKKRLESQALSVVQENVSGQSVVKAFGLEDQWLASFDDRNSGLRRSTARVSFLSSLVERSAYSGVLALDVVIVGIGSWLDLRRLDHDRDAGRLPGRLPRARLLARVRDAVHAGARPGARRLSPHLGTAGGAAGRRRAGQHAAAPSAGRDPLRRRDLRVRGAGSEPARSERRGSPPASRSPSSGRAARARARRSASSCASTTRGRAR